MSENTINLTAKDFDAKTKKGKWVIDMWAEWCGPCKIIAPLFDAAAKEMHGKVSFGKVDVDSESALAERFEVMSIPTLAFFKDGEMVNRTVGALTTKEILKMVEDSF